MPPPPAPPIPPQGRQLRLPLLPDDSLDVSDAVAVVVRDGQVWWFHQGLPIGSHVRDDVGSFRLYASMMCDGGACKLVEVQRAFSVSAVSVKRALKQYRAEGARGFFRSRRTPRGAPVMTPERVTQIQELLDQGVDVRVVAEQLGLKRDTVYRAVKAGRLHRPAKKGGPPISRKR
jgi:transposase